MQNTQNTQNAPNAHIVNTAKKPECSTCYYSVLPAGEKQYLCSLEYLQKRCAYKEKKDVENFRKLWNKRIALEATLLQNNSASDKKTAEAEKATFLTKRQWDREKACFELGDQVAALEKMKSLISSIKEPSEKQRAIRDLEFLLLTPAEQAKLREERMNRRMPGGPRF